MSEAGIHVVKLGGSLMDGPGLPDLVERFARWRAAELGPGPARGLVVVGGGEAADIVRGLDKAYGLDEGEAHWLAVRAMQLNAHLVAAVVKGATLVEGPAGCGRAWAAGRLVIVDPLAWLVREEAEGVTIPHRWTFTSDSIAAHVATRLGAERLTLLKSTLPEGNCTLTRAAELGIVDADFPAAAAGLARVELVNLRSAGLERCRLRWPVPG